METKLDTLHTLQFACGAVAVLRALEFPTQRWRIAISVKRSDWSKARGNLRIVNR